MLGFLHQSNLRAICDRTTGEVMPKKHSEEEKKKRREEYEKSREGDFSSYIAMIGEGFASTIFIALASLLKEATPLHSFLLPLWIISA